MNFIFTSGGILALLFMFHSCKEEVRKIESIEDANALIKEVKEEDSQRGFELQVACLVISHAESQKDPENADAGTTSVLKGKTADEVIEYAQDHHLNAYSVMLLQKDISDKIEEMNSK